MRYLSFTISGKDSYGLVHDGGVLDLGARYGALLPTLRHYIEALSLGFEPPKVTDLTADYALSDITHAPVVGNPGKILCVGLNYEDHRHETGRPKASHPAIFLRYADSLTAHGAPIVMPENSECLDYEGELAVVIGKPGTHIPESSALDHVFGYACFNDGTLRDWQRHTHQFTPGKTFPGTGGFGPELVTADEVTGFADLTIQTRLNGEVMQSAKLGQMIFPVAEVIAYVSGFTNLAAGDVIAMGTPGGVGFKRDPSLFMKVGDQVEVEIETIGKLVNPIAKMPRSQMRVAR